MQLAAFAMRTQLSDPHSSLQSFVYCLMMHMRGSTQQNDVNIFLLLLAVNAFIQMAFPTDRLLLHLPIFFS